MTGRYVRQSVPLEVRGVSRDRPNAFFEQEHDVQLSSPYHSDTVSSYTDGEYTSSGRTTPSHEVESLSGWSYRGVVPGPGTLTGNTTDRSSIFSMGEDEFDRQASRNVRQLFDNIDCMLYEGSMEVEKLKTECEDWVHGRPHLRILGSQVLSTQDPGYQVIKSPRISSQRPLDDITVDELLISGRQLDVQLPQHILTDVPPPHLTPSSPSHTPEEIFEVDGCVEDVIAVDYNPSEEDQRSVRRMRHGMPPLTPQACIRDNIAGSMFDTVWSEALSWLRILLEKYSQFSAFEVEEVADQLSLVLHEKSGGGSLSLDPLSGLYVQSTRDLALSVGRPQDRARGIPAAMAGLQMLGKPHLDSVLTISSKQLLPRESSSLRAEDTLETALPANMPLVRPTSSLTRTAGQPASVKHDQRMTSARVKPTGRPKLLAPLDRAKTPSTNEDKNHVLTNEVLKGRAFPTQPLQLSRNHTLPPISLMEPSSSFSPRANSSKNNNQKKIGSVRASSAIHHEKEGKLPLREKILLSSVGIPGQDGRPSTTHALYRSETPSGMGRRSSTPLGHSRSVLAHGNAALGLSGHLGGGMPKENLVLNVTGSGINPHTEGHASPADGDEIDEADDALDDLSHMGAAHRWGAHHITPHSRRTKPLQHQAAVR